MEKGAFANGSRGCIMKVFGNVGMLEYLNGGLEGLGGYTFV